MHADLTEEEARVTLEALASPGRAFNADDRELSRTARAKLSLSIMSHAQTWYQHLIDQGVHPTTAKAHVRHRYGEVEL